MPEDLKHGKDNTDLQKMVKKMKLSLKEIRIENRKMATEIMMLERDKQVIKEEANTDGCIVIKDYRLRENKVDIIRRIDAKIQKYNLRRGKKDDIKKLEKVKRIIEKRPEVYKKMEKGMEDCTKIFTKKRIVTDLNMQDCELHC